MHFLGILLAAAAMFALGSVWYSPLLFAAAWTREAGVDATKKPDSKGMLRLFAGTALLQLICAAVLDQVMSNWTGAEGVMHGLWVGFLGGVIAVSITTINHLFENKSRKLLYINAAYDLLGFCIMGVVLALI